MNYAELVGRHGSIRAAAREVGLAYSTFHKYLTKEAQDPAIINVMNAENSNMVPANVWKRGVDADGNKYTTHLKPAKAQDDPSKFIDAIREALEAVNPAGATSAPASLHADMVSIYPVADLHVGMLTDAEETGTDWDTKIATKVFREKFDRLLSLTPPTEHAVIAQLGDLTHNDSQENVTPQSKHQLDVDSRYFVILRRAVAVMKYAIDASLQKHGSVIYRGCRGNHDMTAHYAVSLALSEHYRDEPRVTIEDNANEFYVYEFGLNMVLLCHGDKTTHDRLSMFAANEYPEIWGRTKYRRALTGHVHHRRAIQAGGMLVESIETIIPKDAYAHSHGYTSQRALVSIVLDRTQGEICRYRVAA